MRSKRYRTKKGIHDVHETGTASGAAHRAWADLKVTLGGGDHTLFVTAEQGEDRATAALRKSAEQRASFPGASY